MDSPVRRRTSAARVYVFAAIAVAFALLFVRLGVWQVSRLRERRAFNAVVAAREALPVVPVQQLLDSSRTTYRAVFVRGTPDYAREVIVTGRSHNGAPGVYIVTPLRLADGRTVLVNRGWVYTPDAATTDLPKWREPRDSFAGILDTLRSTTLLGDEPGARKVRSLSTVTLPALFPYPVARRYVIATDAGSDSTPVRLARPVLDGGPHLSYAIQWFAFATIAVAGAVIVVLRTRREAAAAEPQAQGLL